VSSSRLNAVDLTPPFFPGAVTSPHRKTGLACVFSSRSNDP
jgi:hypothetical protein